MLICIFCFFQLDIFVDVKTFHDFTVCYRNGSYFQFRFQECLFSLKIEDMILSPGLTLIKQFNNGINNI